MVSGLLGRSGPRTLSSCSLMAGGSPAPLQRARLGSISFLFAKKFSCQSTDDRFTLSVFGGYALALSVLLRLCNLRRFLGFHVANGTPCPSMPDSSRLSLGSSRCSSPSLLPSPFSGCC